MRYNYLVQDDVGATNKDLFKFVRKLSYRQQLNLGMLIALSKKPGLTYDQAYSYSLTNLVMQDSRLVSGLDSMLTFGLDSMQI